ncbi:MAG: efflux RND transporter periplasmic adaptor subunit, partial [Candidatus Omnitrophica bacterium]|nr:efflux RND transporter periplasmic adaptor subunit [Candidatus Omnitrophota bacterium]
MRNKKLKLFFAAIVILGIIAVSVAKIKQKKANGEVIREIAVVIGSIRTFISCTGTVLPKNRLEIKPPVNGRIESILVQEGDKVKTGQILAWMSSTERAALLDAARGKGQASLKYWEETYKSIPLPAPIDAEVIVATTQPGQTVTSADAVLVLSDHLIVRAQVDETDIGKISLDMKTIITLDAYPDTKINASVEHIYYESKTVNNVTIYEVDLLPEEVPAFFRS